MPLRALPLLLAGTLAVAGCSATDEVATTTVTPDRPVIQPGAPGEANTTHTGAITMPVEEPTAADVTFAQAMIVHHAQALEMVEVAREGLTDEQVRSLADRISAAQRPEIGGLVAWLTEHGEPVPQEAVDAGVDVEALGADVGARAPGGGHGHDDDMAGMASPEQLQELAAAHGPEADVLFLELMTAHHEGALAMVDEHALGGTDVRMRETADEMAVEQTVEIDRMADLLERLRG
jgi:uncharacterized protein (DUF305 family)